MKSEKTRFQHQRIHRLCAKSRRTSGSCGGEGESEEAIGTGWGVEDVAGRGVEEAKVL